jgi:formate hydrogenlyase subunit 3/multisubunit Na+/H+ antiporter MnhD subunit
MMQLALAAVAGLAISALLPLLLLRRDRLAVVAGAGAGAASCGIGLWASLGAALGGVRAEWHGPWFLPIGALRVGLDPLSALFLCCLFGVGLFSSIYGAGYMLGFAATRRVAWTAAAFNALLSSVALVFLARDGILFLLSWETMTLLAFILVAFDHRQAEVREGALWFLVINHFGVACLFGYFALLGGALGTFELPSSAAAFPPSLAAALLGLAFVGFGTKMGLAPFHAWLPAAHPVAPSHVSALLSGVLLKCGAYGLLRTLLIVRGVPGAWGWLLFACGAATALLGAINILAATDLKKSLAYSSIENVGIIALSLGLGIVGLASGSSLLAALGLCGALLHVLSHSAFKSLLFSAAGSVLHGAHTRDLERMGGLLKRMPATAALFLCGAASAAAIPGFAGFASEFLVYRGLLEGLSRLRPGGQAALAAALATLALTGGLAAAGLTRAFGIAFSGAPRSEPAAQAREQGPAMLWPMLALAVVCLGLGIVPRAAFALASPAVAQFGVDPAVLAGPIAQATRVGQLGLLFLSLCAVLTAVRDRLLRARPVAASVTWGCGYAAPTPRMQYSAASFASPALSVLGGAVKMETSGALPETAFPAALERRSPARDRLELALYQRGSGWISRQLASLRALHRPQLQQYLLYMFVALVLLLSWAARLGRR